MPKVFKLQGGLIVGVSKSVIKIGSTVIASSLVQYSCVNGCLRMHSIMIKKWMIWLLLVSIVLNNWFTSGFVIKLFFNLLANV